MRPESGHPNEQAASVVAPDGAATQLGTGQPPIEERIVGHLVTKFPDSSPGEWAVVQETVAFLRSLPVARRMMAMGMHAISLDTSGPLRGGLALNGDLTDPAGFGTVHFKNAATVVWLPNPEET